MVSLLRAPARTQTGSLAPSPSEELLFLQPHVFAFASSPWLSLSHLQRPTPQKFASTTLFLPGLTPIPSAAIPPCCAPSLLCPVPSPISVWRLSTWDRSQQQAAGRSVALGWNWGQGGWDWEWEPRPQDPAGQPHPGDSPALQTLPLPSHSPHRGVSSPVSLLSC